MRVAIQGVGHACYPSIRFAADRASIDAVRAGRSSRRSPHPTLATGRGPEPRSGPPGQAAV